ncbi:MAG: DEAD/DEAH box helicase family protein [Lachnospiraceae bacterium]
MEEMIEVRSSGKIRAKDGKNGRVPYQHQTEAMECLTKMDQLPSFRTMVVLPTGGGKTYTATTWLLQHAVNRKKKVLWLAHRQMLLDQAAEAFQQFAYADILTNAPVFSYRIISGAAGHDPCINIQPDDDVLIVGKDSIARKLEELDRWLEGQKELYFVVDEAHHATAKTYRKIIQYVEKKVPGLKLIGLTATPFRTAEAEAGLLGKIFPDGLDEHGMVVHNQRGITYQIGLKTLISTQILSKPRFESLYTDEDFGKDVGLDAWKSIQNRDLIPEDVAQNIVESAGRNRLIVDTYLKKKEAYGQTIVFAVNVDHAIVLSALFNKNGVRADYIVSSVRDMATGVTISQKENERKLQEYRDGKLQVLINVNILTEGVDVPQTKTVFLARPTVSSILMTQMIGRALRGTAAGGTKEAYIVSFVDNWNEHIAWVNPETLFDGENEFSDSDPDTIRQDVRLISIAKMQEFASILDDSIDTERLEAIPFEQRIPIGMYVFHYLQKNETESLDLSCQVMVYDSTKEAYEKLMQALPELFSSYQIADEEIPEELLQEMEDQCHSSFFCGEMIPPYEAHDIEHILQYYAQKETVPTFYTFDEVSRRKLDVKAIAEEIYKKDLRRSEEAEYIDQLWEQSDDNLLQMFFGRKRYFLKQLEIEMSKLQHPEIYEDIRKKQVQYDKKALEDLPLGEIRQYAPDYEKKLRDDAFASAWDAKNRVYRCPVCGRESDSRVLFQVDHKIPMNRGGKSVAENLQILCRFCNAKKGEQ